MRLYPAQVIKQADLVLAMQWQSHAFTPEQKARNVDYYERRTVRDSSLSACTQAVMCAEVGHLELAHDYAYEAALIDLRDLHANTRDGLHMASLAGPGPRWSAASGLARRRGYPLARPAAARCHRVPAVPVALERISGQRVRHPRRRHLHVARRAWRRAEDPPCRRGAQAQY
ncbi:glycosyl hydrolase family 65 central catalytic domain protein [Mycobacterium xenopi 4042]|uniref:Glycosyl hydrolase family 65 central catalytic domain protein n=1 Tax=Mycobacterium xenopi 4042 TaxID=1299334 RepID=X7YK22_MYCXE|nr:glycosyl hydrolase family 65 central catalytic domain protein [Mycobacterium xenopi 4042]